MTKQPDTHHAHRFDLRDVRRSRWFQPLLAIILGLVLLAAISIGGHPEEGTLAFAIMVAFAIFLLAGSRSETVRALRGDGRDERFELIQLRAASVAARVVLIAVVVLFLVEVLRGNSGSPYDWLSALGGATFLATVLYLRSRV
jgi:sterol desaturase/sphingolipid hydroxylase (fatty acid hydroxylase superfamily)